MDLKHRARLSLVAVAALVVAALVAPAANAATPAPGYTQFTGCPTAAEVPTTQFCMHSKIKGGFFKMGNKKVPIENPITITGGVNEELEHFAATSQGGMKPVKQKVPGGVVGLTGLTWLLELLGSEALTLYAVTEAMGPPALTLTTIDMPIRVHLINSTLGNNCYVGSPTNPIQLHLTTGTTSPPPPNTPISGKEGELGYSEATSILTLNNATFVDNSFSAPGASGCVLTLFGFIPISINGLVNTQSGLPAPAGTNETVQEIDSQFAPVTKVYP